MHCPRLKHFVRLEPNGQFGKCGHMVKGKSFDTLENMQSSEWLQDISNKMNKNIWPEECKRCQMTEEVSGNSIRKNTIERDRILKAMNKNYLIVGGVLDNICNSACQSCNADLSTKIGSLQKKNYKKINNYDKFFLLPQQRIMEVDVNGGEPTASPNYKKLLKNLPTAVKIVRLNTNGSRLINEIVDLLKQNIRVIVTLSFDGTDLVHDYTRWPIKWVEYKKNVKKYLELRKQYKNLKLDFWTTVSCLNVGDFENIIQYANNNDIDHSYGFCVIPATIDIRYKNRLTQEAKQKLSLSKNNLLQSIGEKCCSFDKNNSEDLKTFVNKQDSLRQLSFKNYFNFDTNEL